MATYYAYKLVVSTHGTLRLLGTGVSRGEAYLNAEYKLERQGKIIRDITVKTKSQMKRIFGAEFTEKLKMF